MQRRKDVLQRQGALRVVVLLGQLASASKHASGLEQAVNDDRWCICSGRCGCIKLNYSKGIEAP